MRLHFPNRVVLVLAIAIAPAAGAQRATPDPFAPGTRVRVGLRDAHRQVSAAGPSFQSLRGTVVRVTADTLVLDLRPGIAAVPRVGIAGMSVSRGMPSHLEGGFRNSVAGAVFGAFLGFVVASHQGGWDWETVGETAAVGAGAGFLTGLIWPAERWRRVPRSVIVAPSGGGGASPGGRATF